MNFESQPIQPHEIESMKSDAGVIRRVILSYRLMLDFYGMALVSEETGLLKRGDNYTERYQNLAREYFLSFPVS
jgi:hypothetical protein